MFVRDIAPELARDRDFQAVGERPGQLIYSDGAPPALGQEGSGSQDDAEQEEDLASLDAPVGVEPSGPMIQNIGGSLVADDLPELLARHIHVDFSAEGAGTSVHVHGHVERDVCHGLELLGTPRHWPETADEPHD